MFERFTERARQVVVLGQEEARNAPHNHIGVEHILLGLFREEEGFAARTLTDMGLSLEECRAWVFDNQPPEQEAVNGQMPFTDRAKRVLEVALREALALGHNYIGTEHILLSLMREDSGLAKDYFDEHDLSRDDVHHEVIRSLSGGERDRRPTPTLANTLTRVDYAYLRDLVGQQAVGDKQARDVYAKLAKLARRRGTL
jgi:ATP-dependent Clp protease ATP-binding subunit ClpC